MSDSSLSHSALSTSNVPAAAPWVDKPDAHVTVGSREYIVSFHYATGEPHTVRVVDAWRRLPRINLNGPTARAAIAKAMGEKA